MTAKKTAPKIGLLDDLADSAAEVETAEIKVKQAEMRRTAADAELETKRAKVWRLLGTPFGSVRFGMFNFSRLMLLIGVAFAGMMVGSIFVGPVLGLMIVGCVAAAGFLWIRAKL